MDAIRAPDGSEGFSPEDVRDGGERRDRRVQITEPYRISSSCCARRWWRRVSMARIDRREPPPSHEEARARALRHPLAEEPIRPNSAEPHRALAREAVQKLASRMKNDGNVLPLSRSIPRAIRRRKVGRTPSTANQSGGWTVKGAREGTGRSREGTSISNRQLEIGFRREDQVTDVNGNGIDKEDTPL